MSRSWVAIALGCTLSVMLAAPASSASRHLVIRNTDVSHFPTISATVAVDSGVPVRSSTLQVKAGMTVVPSVTVESLSHTQQVEVVLAMDTSGSMHGRPLAAAVAAARDFIRSLPSNVAVGILSFSDREDVILPTT